MKAPTTSTTVALTGLPNVGKSSLVNCLLGTDLAIVCPRPQTTRNTYRCIFTVDNHEIILVDTPGLHRGRTGLNDRYNREAARGAGEGDINLLLIDLTKGIMDQFSSIQSFYQGPPLGPSWVVFTKADLLESPEKLPLGEALAKARQLFPSLKEGIFAVSTKTGRDIHRLMGLLCERALPGPHHYRGVISNKNERFFVAEYVREQIFFLLRDEVPYECAVIVEEFEDARKERGYCRISATILVNRPSQRAILVGSKGSMIKEIGLKSRPKIEAILASSAHLNLHVKISPGWFKNSSVLEELGFPRQAHEARVWRKK